MRTINQRGLDLIKDFEGLRLDVYRDAVGKLTIGFGHLITPADQLELGDVISEEEAEDLLRLDLIKAENAVERLVKVSLNDNQFAALVSFIFNLGEGNLKKSTLLRRLNRGDYRVGEEFLKWNKAGGKALKGLTRRREAERKLFEST